MGPDRHASVKETTTDNQNLSGTDEYITVHCGHMSFFPLSTRGAAGKLPLRLLLTSCLQIFASVRYGPSMEDLSAENLALHSLATKVSEINPSNPHQKGRTKRTDSVIKQT